MVPPNHHMRTSVVPPPPQGMQPLYHPHHPHDPSITASANTVERNSPVPAHSESAKSDQLPPVLSPSPAQFTRPQMLRYPPSGNNIPPPVMPVSPIRHPHIIPPQQHMQQQPRPTMPYHPGMPPNYYGAYIPQPNVPPPAEESLPPASYQQSFGGYPESDSPQDMDKVYEEENSGEFGGLVSYFSSQREDDLDT